ncbi:MAG TPA: TonB-dependent receptor [Xanthomonadales bacterium]|nr:TonB-dependent receptor [Xanthomonadales bacterium]
MKQKAGELRNAIQAALGTRAVAGMVFLLLAIAPTAGMAQEAAESNNALEEVMVTAQRREENLQTTPVAISAVTSQMIENNRIFNVTDLAANTPSFSLTANTPLDLELNIRGVTNTRLDSPTADPSVGMFVDDVYIGRTGDINVDFFDIDRIEVIRGPQGVLLGKNVVGGALSVFTKRPEFDPSAQVLMSIGNYDSVLVNGFATGKVADNLAGRFSFQYRTHDGYGYDLLNDRELDDLDSKQFRGQLAYEPDDKDFTARLIVDYSKDSSNGITVIAVPDKAPAGLRPWSTLRAFLGLTDPRVAVPERSQYAGDPAPMNQYFRRNTTGITLDMEWGFDGFDLTSITGYRDVSSGQMYDQTGAGPDVFDNQYNFSDFLAFNPTAATFLFSSPVREDADITAFSQEIRLTSNTDSRWDWIAGVYYKHDEVDKYDQFFGENISGALPTLSGESHWDNRGEMDSLAGFAQLGYQISDAWKATIGGRYTKDDKSGFVEGIKVTGGDRFNPNDTAPLTPLVTPFATNYGDDWSEFTPQGIIEFQPSDQWYWYGSISTGFKGGGYEDTPANAIGANFAFDPETVTNYEIGFKATLMDGRMRLNATTFYMDYKDLQVQQTNQDCLCNITDNASNAEIKGVEMELQWAVGGGVILFAGASMLDHEYIDFIENSGQVSSGNKLQRTPDNQFNAGFDWSFGSGRFADAFSLNANYYWQDELYWQPSNANKEEAYSLINARLSYEQPGSDWMVSAWIKNVTDELYRTNIIPFFGEEVGQYGAPQTYGVDFRINF